MSLRLNNLAIALRDHFGKTGSMTDLEEAIAIHHPSIPSHVYEVKPTPRTL
jgi:hypothetical protein